MLISKISEKIGEINSLEPSARHIELRRENRIKTIHSSLAIENNSLSLEQITAIIEGKRVLGAPNEIQEVRNAVQAYDLLLSLDSTKEKDLLRAHALMMKDLVRNNGQYRSGGVGVFNGQNVVHVAPPANRVPALMKDLFRWAKRADVHPLIKSCVFHYEFEFIHPFQDGNGRLGRLWQTVILKDWKNVFAWIPVESLIKDNQAKYYRVLRACDAAADSVNQKKILEAVKKNPHITLDELSKKIGISRKSIAANVKKLQEAGLLKRQGADKNGYWELLDK